MQDTIETINGSVIQHGHNNERIYIMHLKKRGAENLIERLDGMAIDEGYEKIFAKIPATCWEIFEKAGYVKEALVPGFYNGTQDGLFVAKFLSAQRQKVKSPINLDFQTRDRQCRDPSQGLRSW